MRGVVRPRAEGYGVVIGSDYYRVAPSSGVPIQTYTRDSLAQRQDDQGAAGSNVLEQGYGFSRQNLTGGEGLDEWPRPQGEIGTERDTTRFWDSSNIAISRPEAGAPYQWTLVKTVEDFWTPDDPPVDMGTSRDAFYVAEDTDIHRFDDITDTTPDNTETLPADVVNMDVGIDDTVVAVLTNGDIYIKPASSEEYVRCYQVGVDGDPAVAAWWVKSRIIAATTDTTSAANGAVVEIDPVIGGTPATPTATQTVTLIDTYAGEMNACVDAGHAIVAAFSDGSLRSYVSQVDTAGGVPALTIRGRTQVSTLENPYALGWNAGDLLVMTLAEAPTGTEITQRLYRATVLDDRFNFTVANLQLLRAWNGAVETAPAYTANMVATRDEVYFAVGEGTDNWNVWRYDVVTQGLFRHMTTARTAAVALCVFDGRLLFADGADVIVESEDTFAASGYLITPHITFGLNTPINWTAFITEVENLAISGVRVALYRSSSRAALTDPDDPTWILVENYTDPTQSGFEKSVVNAQSNTLALQLKLFRSTVGTTAPNVKRLSVRGLPAHRDWVVEVPVSVSDTVSAPGRMPVRIPGLGDSIHTGLFAKQGESTTLRLFDPPITLRGIVDAVAEPVAYVTSRGSQGRYAVVRFLGKLLGTDPTAAVQGNAGMGVAAMGITTMGIGEV